MEETFIKDIIIGDRKRPVDSEKVRELAESIKEIGLISPILIDDNNCLIAGAHRLEAFKLLGFESIPAVVSNGDDLTKELQEIDENLIRNKLHYTEEGELLLRRKEIYEELHPETKQYVIGGEMRQNSATTDSAVAGFVKNTSDKVAKSETVIRDEIRIAKNTTPEIKQTLKEYDIPKTDALDLARLEPEEQKKVVEEIEQGKKIKSAIKGIQLEKRNEAMQAQSIPEGKFQIILADPPWSYNNSGLEQSALQHYPTMTVEEIAKLPIQNLATNISVLFLWATAPLLPDALYVMKVWGFEYKTHLVWVKDRSPGIGWWVQTKHELLLIGAKENTPKPAIKPVSVFTGETGKHSQKPTEAYEIIESMYPNVKKIELFARNKRENWSGWGNEI